ncbi:MAG: capsular polysaccharide biosynthesis protein, partial [Pseudomonadota bacterium]
GQPFYAGWDLSDDEAPPPRRGRPRTADQLFAAAMLLAPAWHDPALDRPSSFEEAALGLAARARAWREGQQPAIALGMRLWKRRTVAAFLEGEAPRPRFADDPDRALARAAEEGRRLVVWASAETPELAARAAARGVPLLRMEDGFLRSRGLGAALVPAASLVLDDLGIYFDPTRPSRLEALIEAAPALPEVARARAAALRTRLLETGVTKYNTGAAAPLPATGGRPVILVPGQVEDDASIRLGAGTVRTNLGLLEAAREANPGAFLVYKPHPDVEAGLRPGKIAAEDLARLADHVAEAADPAALLARADGLWTMTSLMGFEALLRGVPVTALGRPFYAGWGLTEDRTGLPDPFPRRRARPGLDGLVHATLIDYPRYRDPVSGLPCPPEVIVERLATGAAPRQGPALRLLARAQGLLASYATLWR